MARMVAENRAPKTIKNVIQVVKMVVASGINEEGDQVYPRKWNHDFIDLPEVSDQHTPTFSAEVVQGIVSSAMGHALFAPRGDRNEDGGSVWAGDREAYQPRRLYDQDPTKRVVWLGSNAGENRGIATSG